MSETTRDWRLQLKIAVAILAVAVGMLVAPVAADAAWGNKIVNSSNRCTTFVWEPGDRGRTTICGLNNYAFDVRYVVVMRGTCLEIGFWAFTRYCSPNYDRFIYMGPGTHFIR